MQQEDKAGRTKHDTKMGSLTFGFIALVVLPLDFFKSFTEKIWEIKI